MNAIFVYGLLKPGFSLHHVAAPFVVRSTAGKTRGHLYDAGIPAARFDELGEIEGFVLWLDAGRVEDALEILDDLEDEGEVYLRVPIEVATDDDGVVAAHAYHYILPVDGLNDVGPSWALPPVSE